MEKKSTNQKSEEWQLMSRIYRFEAEVEGDVLSRETFPIYDDSLKNLLGGFSLKRGDVIIGFVAGVDHPTALAISTGASFYFTPMEDCNGMISHGVISDIPNGQGGILIHKAYEGGGSD